MPLLMILLLAAGIVGHAATIDTATAGESPPAVTELDQDSPPARGFLDYVADKAMSVIRERAASKAPKMSIVLDLAEKVYRVVRNEQEIARYRREGRRILMELAALAEGLQGESQRAGAVEAEMLAEIRRLDDEWKSLTALVNDVRALADEALKRADRAHEAVIAARQQAERQRQDDKKALQVAIDAALARYLRREGARRDQIATEPGAETISPSGFDVRQRWGWARFDGASDPFSTPGY